MKSFFSSLGESPGVKVLLFLLFLVTTSVFPDAGARRKSDVFDVSYTRVPVPVIQEISSVSSPVVTVPVKV